ncbi:MAG: hypothetical protein C4346_19140 [Chloroflexota bacterium]
MLRLRILSALTENSAAEWIQRQSPQGRRCLRALREVGQVRHLREDPPEPDRRLGVPALERGGAPGAIEPDLIGGQQAAQPSIGSITFSLAA